MTRYDNNRILITSVQLTSTSNVLCICTRNIKPGSLLLVSYWFVPKKGKLSLPANFRGIEMLAALSALYGLYGRIFTTRLRGWCLINYLQSAFQQGKSTIHQIFTLRNLTEIARRTNTTLYIGFFDLEKAFDKVFRLL